MSVAGFIRGLFVLMVAVAVAPGELRAGALIVNGDFSACKNSRDLRRHTKAQGWYESRRDTTGSRAQLILSKKNVAGDATPKAMIKGHPKMNTYLSQRLSRPQTEEFSVQYDVLVKEISPANNRSAFFMIGDDKDKNGGPNSTGTERFVFLGFENAPTKGKLNLFAREGKSDWDKKTIVARDLDPNRWYTIAVKVYVSAKAYEVSVQGVTPKPVELNAFAPSGKPPRRLTHLSFASWDDGAGTFYVDNVTGND